jgi:hypothetical protein
MMPDLYPFQENPYLFYDTTSIILFIPLHFVRGRF